jgi:hypothetical protein
MSDDSPRETRPTRSMLIVNARVRTNDSRRPWVDAVLIDEARIEAVGTSAELRKRRTGDVVVLDARGMLLVPTSSGDAITRGGPANLVLLEPSADASGDTPRREDIVFQLADGRIVVDRDSLGG